MNSKPGTPLLEVNDLHVEFDTYGGIVRAVRGVSLSVEAGKTLAIVGESGCGKSVTMQALMGLIPTPPGRITSGSALLFGREILNLSLKEANQIRGRQIGMIFQDPMTSLNPTMTVGTQIGESLRIHEGLGAAEARARAIELLRQVQIPDPQSRVDLYPFQYSGGMRQRVMIAIAIACNPSLLIADEPTTALDVTIQAQILGLLKRLQRERGMSIILITHDLGVVSQVADEVAVMYAGQVVERGTLKQVFESPSHPYTRGLQQALPDPQPNSRRKLVPIEGSPPDLFSPPPGCGYFARCSQAMRACEDQPPPTFNLTAGHQARCWLHHPERVG